MLLLIPAAHQEVVTSLQFSPYYPRVFCSTSGDDTGALWDLRNSPDSCNIAKLVCHSDPVNHALFVEGRDQLLLTASDDRTVACWDVREISQPVGVIRGFGEGVNKMLRLPSGVPGSGGGGSSNAVPSLLVACACDDGQVYVHSVGTPEDSQPQNGLRSENAHGTLDSLGTLMDRFWVSTNTVNDLALTPNPNLLLTASEDNAIRLWNIAPLLNGRATGDDRLVASFEEFEDPVNHIAVRYSSPPNEVPRGIDSATPSSTCWLYAACSEFVFAVDLDPINGVFGGEARTFSGHQDYVRGLEFFSEETLLTVSDDSTAIEWSLSTVQLVRQVKLHEGLVMASAMSAAKDILVTGTDNGEIRAWSLPFSTETCCASSPCEA
ncbi:unnamed protein product [Trypanosoma congolense IL3000]|uniref:WGS project CAEQ00000000 data, annotated contig 1103 n=1 Tax=Trypanosoma congolense (strain IL3000) TaxID=1068625 RepID=F9W3T3_TRYCI|nr:unnamed protein product [Trypanosoma congolense IL3000]